MSFAQLAKIEKQHTFYIIFPLFFMYLTKSLSNCSLVRELSKCLSSCTSTLKPNDVVVRIALILLEREAENYRLLEALINGNINDDDFLVLQPGREVYETGDERVIDGRPC